MPFEAEDLLSRYICLERPVLAKLNCHWKLCGDPAKPTYLLGRLVTLTLVFLLRWLYRVNR